ncbi:MAG: aldo/keto reductase, partial [Rhodospirillaceae bacterium]|nr:aldo/keto reductase [Rhodospirillaceae bacterium]
LALAWVLAQGEDIATIPGTRRIERLEQNVAAAAIALSDGDVARLSKLADLGVVGARY